MKKFLVLLLLCLLMPIYVLAESSYLSFYSYDINPQNLTINATLQNYSPEIFKQFSKAEKKLYKKCLKYNNKWLAWRNYNEVLKQDPQFLPALICAFNNTSYKQKFYYMEQIKQINLQEHLFDDYSIDFLLADSNFWGQNYNRVINIVEPMIKKNDAPILRFYLAESYLNVKNYDNAIKNANTIIDLKQKDTLYKYALNVKFLAYYQMAKFLEANKIANELYSYSFPDKKTASLRMAETTQNSDTKLKYYNETKKLATNEQEKWKINNDISYYLDKKIENAINKISGYYKPLLWNDIIKKDANYMTIPKENSRFDDFYNDANVCISKYTGNNLKACFNDIKSKQDDISKRLAEEYVETQRQIAEAERIRQLQLINANMVQANYLQSQQNYLQSQQNNLIQQQNYELSRPRYYNSTTTRSGNMYYTNTYSY